MGAQFMLANERGTQHRAIRVLSCQGAHGHLSDLRGLAPGCHAGGPGPFDSAPRLQAGAAPCAARRKGGDGARQGGSWCGHVVTDDDPRHGLEHVREAVAAGARTRETQPSRHSEDNKRSGKHHYFHPHRLSAAPVLTMKPLQRNRAKTRRMFDQYRVPLELGYLPKAVGTIFEP